MAEYINREATKAEVRKMFPSLVDRIKIIEVINSIPAADVATWEELQKTWKIANHDVAPVRHGRWKPYDLTYGRSIYYCTACNQSAVVPTALDEPIFNYCPNCGAKMDGGET